MLDVLKLLRSAGDETRLRILGILDSEPLSVGEILDILEMGQSRVSRHLKILADAGLLLSHRVGNRVYYGLETQVRRVPLAQALIECVDELAGAADYKGNGLQSGLIRDRAKLTEILELRKRTSLDHFQRIGQDHDRLQQTYVDSSYYRREALAELGASPGIVADLGCGTGELSELITKIASRTIGVDQSPRVLDLARTSCPAGEFRLGELAHLPLRNEEANAVVVSMVLHHLPDPSIGLSEANRVLAENGTLVVVDLDEHDEEAMQRDFADFWPGFPPKRLEDMIEASGFKIENKKSGRGNGRLKCLIYRAKKI